MLQNLPEKLPKCMYKPNTSSCSEHSAGDKLPGTVINKIAVLKPEGRTAVFMSASLWSAAGSTSAENHQHDIKQCASAAPHAGASPGASSKV